MIASIYQLLFLWYCNLEGRLRSNRWRSSRQAATLCNFAIGLRGYFYASQISIFTDGKRRNQLLFWKFYVQDESISILFCENYTEPFFGSP